ncbi:hypothetical protein SVIO_091510 [Streptomyces violaceusniger]|uniref:Uncharacterized protein n=1 Tax=Streptomyces violaceusniger TaxID=68280 RepID=A0A4D4LJ91_STRVO|nr:hypothetical protein SVIO_091510 [Streptomyces violaceusniger]
MKRTVVEQQPAEMSAWDALRAGFEVILTATPERALELSRLIFDTPSLHSHYIEKRRRWQAELVPVIRARLGNRPGHPAPDTQAKALTDGSTWQISTTSASRRCGTMAEARIPGTPSGRTRRHRARSTAAA